MKGYQAKSVNAQATRFYDGFIKDIHFYIAQSLRAQGQLPQAIESYQEALRLDVQNIVVLEGLALTYLQAKQYEQAIETFNMALGLNPQNASLLNNIAIAYMEQGDRNQAEQFFKMALGVDPTYSAARQNLNQLMDSQH
jgi:Flp pilus assembly protein TadD